MDKKKWENKLIFIALLSTKVRKYLFCKFHIDFLFKLHSQIFRPRVGGGFEYLGVHQLAKGLLREQVPLLHRAKSGG